ncbi:MAG TPA: L-arabinose isomerase, partial [Deinococcales bacterium]|nr:L-arabinose isomerase [Deinococcales bacterium]
MKNLATPSVWLLCGSQHLYGPEPLRQVSQNAQAVANALNEYGRVPLPVRFAGLLTTADEITKTILAANADPDCAGLVLWMHTFSPAKMWISGLARLAKPFLHLHTQFNQNLPWDEIDMDFMNLNQAAHGDREAGFLHSRLRLERKVVVGHFSEPVVQDQVGAWARAARAWHDLQGARIARFGDNMRNVAVTEGDKVAAELRFGFTVLGYGVGDLVEAVNAVPDGAVNDLLAEYERAYTLVPDARDGGAKREAVRYEARVELGLRAFLEEGNFKGFTTNFEDLHGLKQLPGLAVQRLMADGCGFGPEGDWKTAALLRAV